MSLPTLEISSCLLIPTFSKQTCNKSVRWIGYRDAARYLYATCLTDLAPAGHLQLSFGYIWPNSSHFLLKFCRTLKISGGRACLWERKATRIDQIHSSSLLVRYAPSHLHHKRKTWGQNCSHTPQGKDMMTDVSVFWVVLFGSRPLSHWCHCSRCCGSQCGLFVW